MHYNRLSHTEKNAVLQWLRERGWTIVPAPWHVAPCAVAPGFLTGVLGMVDIEAAVLAQAAHETTAVILPTRIKE